MTPNEYTEALISAARMPDRDAIFIRLIAACHDVANSGGPAMRTQAITRVRELARQYDQEEPCPNPSTAKSSASSATPAPNSQTTDTNSEHGSPATSTRSRTIKTTTAPSRRRTP